MLRPMRNQPTWGVTATVKAPLRDTLNFAAHHLDLGAHRVFLYLDDADETTAAALGTHPGCRVIPTGRAYWQSHGYRPKKHQVRQQVNATHCLRHDPGVDWLAHIDVDEYLWPEDASLADQLAALPGDTLSARIRPVEALAPDPADPPPNGAQWFKSCASDARRRRRETAAIYPEYGSCLKGGFLSHVQGKVLVRTGQKDIRLRIHHAARGNGNDTATPLPGTRLCHLHAPGYDLWQQHYRYRLTQGAYRAGLRAAPGAPAGPDGGRMTLHALLSRLEQRGPAALRDFYQQIGTATPALRARLAAHGHLHLINLDLDAKRARHFPDHA